MARKITNEQMKNLIMNILFSKKRDAQRNYHNLLWCRDNDKNPAADPKLRLRKYLEFELQSYYHHEDGKKYVFTINKDYSTNDYECDDLDAAIDLANEHLYTNHEWYRNIIQ